MWLLSDPSKLHYALIISVANIVYFFVLAIFLSFALSSKEPMAGRRLLHWFDFLSLLIVFSSLAWLIVNFSFLIAAKMFGSLLIGAIIFIKMRQSFLFHNLVEEKGACLGAHPFSAGVWVFSFLSTILLAWSMEYFVVFLFGSIVAFAAPLLFVILMTRNDSRAAEA
jgi:hypothetical protein